MFKSSRIFNPLHDDLIVLSSQVKLLITNNSFCIAQRATAMSRTGIFRGYGEAEAPPGFQAGWSDCKYFLFYLSLFIFFAHLEFLCIFLFSLGYIAVSKLSPDVLSRGGRCLGCVRQHRNDGERKESSTSGLND
jgi:hypothetical protein